MYTASCTSKFGSNLIVSYAVPPLLFRLLKHNNSKLKQSDSVEFSKLKEKTQNDDVNEVTREVEKLETKNENENLEKQKIPQQIFQAGRNEVLRLISIVKPWSKRNNVMQPLTTLLLQNVVCCCIMLQMISVKFWRKCIRL